jgi:hypothetical protein
MTVLSLVIIVSAIFLSVIMAADPHPHVRAYIQQRDPVGTVGTPLAVSPSPTATPVGKVGVPLHQGSTDDEEPLPSTSTTPTPKVGVPLSRTSTFATETQIPTLTAKVEDPSPTETSAGIKGSPLSTVSLTQRPSSSPNSAILAVAIISGVVFLGVVGLVFWRIQKNRCLNKNGKDIEDEDAMEAYSKYWKGKRNSGGNVEKGNDTTTPVVEEKGDKAHSS